MTASVQPKKVWPSDDDVSERYPIYTRANTGEVFVDASSPFTWSLLGRIVYEGGFRDALIRMGTFTEDDFGPLETGRCQCVASFGGYVYFSLSVSRILGVRAPGMSVEAVDQSFFGEHPDAPPYEPHPDDADEARSAATGKWMAGILAPAPDPNESHRRDIDALLAASPAFEELSEPQLVAYIRRVVDELRGVFATHMVNLYASNIATGIVAQSASAVGMSHRVARIYAGLGDVDSAQQSFDLWEISRIIRASAELTAEFDRGLDGLLDRIGALNSADALNFLAKWHEFIETWGFLGPSVWELRSPTYASAPRIVLHMLDGARNRGDDASPQSRSNESAAERARAVAEILAALPDDESKGMFQAATSVVPALLPRREGSKVQCTRLVNEVREAARALGERFVAAGVISDWSDILMLLDSEIDAFFDAPSSWKQTIADRRAELTELEGRTPPFIVNGKNPEWEDFIPKNTSPDPAAVGTTLTGLGVSPGKHTGRVRVVLSIQDDTDIEPDDVLVAMTTDSSWGALFLTAGAVVVQTGAAISHAAIVSRELGIPSAVSVSDATVRLTDGMLVSVDGDTGEVVVIES